MSVPENYIELIKFKIDFIISDISEDEMSQIVINPIQSADFVEIPRSMNNYNDLHAIIEQYGIILDISLLV